MEALLGGRARAARRTRGLDLEASRTFGVAALDALAAAGCERVGATDVPPLEGRGPFFATARPSAAPAPKPRRAIADAAPANAAAALPAWRARDGAALYFETVAPCGGPPTEAKALAWRSDLLGAIGRRDVGEADALLRRYRAAYGAAVDSSAIDLRVRDAARCLGRRVRDATADPDASLATLRAAAVLGAGAGGGRAREARLLEALGAVPGMTQRDAWRDHVGSYARHLLEVAPQDGRLAKAARYAARLEASSDHADASSLAGTRAAVAAFFAAVADADASLETVLTLSDCDAAALRFAVAGAAVPAVLANARDAEAARLGRLCAALADAATAPGDGSRAEARDSVLRSAIASADAADAALPRLVAASEALATYDALAAARRAYDGVARSEAARARCFLVLAKMAAFAGTCVADAFEADDDTSWIADVRARLGREAARSPLPLDGVIDAALRGDAEALEAFYAACPPAPAGADARSLRERTIRAGRRQLYALRDRETAAALADALAALPSSP